jgi:nucleotide-binding universal stress UspA family protein
MKILVPIDFSINSIHAFEFALALAKREKSEIVLLYVIEQIYDFAFQSAVVLDHQWEDAESKLNELIRQFEAVGVPVSFQIEEGTPSILIAKKASETEATLIVMGTRGANGLKKLLIGSTASNVIKETTTPVLVIPENSNLTHIHKITLALEFADHEPKYIDWVIRKSGQWEMGLDFLHIQVGNDFKEELSVLGLEKYIFSKYPGLPMKIHTFFAETPTDGLEMYMEEHEESILMVCHKQRSLWAQLMESSDSLHLTYSSPIPILVMV